MKKIILSVCALSAMFLTSCSNEVDMFETIGTPKGILHVDCIYDTEMTRATQEAGENWIIKADETTLHTGSNTILAGTYTVKASNYDNPAKALEANDNWGDAFYSGSQSGVVVNKGDNANVTINCGKAQNARLKTTFNLLSTFTNVKLVADIDDSGASPTGRQLEFTTTTPKDKFAYFEAGTTIKCKLSYTFNSKEINKPFDFPLAGAATENVINVKTNDNGTITIDLSKITYDNEFGTGSSNIITIDAVSGAEVPSSTGE